MSKAVPAHQEQHTDVARVAYPLSGITVIDLSHVYNGPYATFLMAMSTAVLRLMLLRPVTL